MPAARGPYRVDLQNPISRHPLNRGLVSWWLPLPGLTGGRRLWDLRSVSHGTMSNLPTDGSAWASDPNWFGAVRYGGTDDVVDFSGLSSYFTTDEASIHLAVKRTLATPAGSPDSGFCLFGADATDNGTHYPYLNGLVYSNIFRSSGNRVNGITPRSDVDRTQWHLLSVTTKTGTGTYTIYQNAQVMTTANGEASVTIPTTCHLGRSISTQDDWFVGLIGSVHLSKRCHSAPEVAAFYAEWQAGFPTLLRRYPERSWFVLRESAAAAGGATIPVFAHHYRMQGIQ